jgi:hypothetical protein
MRHVSENGEYDEPCQEAGKTVDTAGKNRITVGHNSQLHYIISQHCIMSSGSFMLMTLSVTSLNNKLERM